MNKFCLFCVGGWYNRKEVRECKDKYCPFWRDRFENLKWQNGKRISKNRKKR